MEVITADNRQHILRIDPGEEVMSSLKDYCAKEKIHGASFTAIGGAKRIVVSWYNPATKKYEEKTYEADSYEIVSLIGNVSAMDGTVIIHAHGSFSYTDTNVFGGHMHEIVISLTCEIALHPLDRAMQRQMDAGTGLKLLCPS